MKENALHFEAVQVSMVKDKNGVMLKLAIHPDDVPKDLMAAWVGTRYMVAMVQLDDNEQPVKPKDKTDGERAVASAGALCRDIKYQKWINADNEEEAAETMRSILEIDSRSELREDDQARSRFYKHRDLFVEALDSGKVTSARGTIRTI